MFYFLKQVLISAENSKLMNNIRTEIFCKMSKKRFKTNIKCLQNVLNISYINFAYNYTDTYVFCIHFLTAIP